MYAIIRGCSSMVELQLPKLIAWVRFPSPAPVASNAVVAQLVEHSLGKGEVGSSTLRGGTNAMVKPSNFEPTPNKLGNTSS